MAIGVVPGSLHLAPLRAPVECDEGGEVGGPDRGLGHALGHGAGDVDPAQPRHGVQVHEVVVRLCVPNTLKPGLAPGELGAVVQST